MSSEKKILSDLLGGNLRCLDFFCSARLGRGLNSSGLMDNVTKDKLLSINKSHRIRHLGDDLSIQIIQNIERV